MTNPDHSDEGTLKVTNDTWLTAILGAIVLPLGGWVWHSERRLTAVEVSFLALKEDIDRLETKTDKILEHLLERR